MHKEKMRLLLWLSRLPVRIARPPEQGFVAGKGTSQRAAAFMNSPG